MTVKDLLKEPEHYQHAALVLAVEVIRERVGRLPRDDREDLYQLVKELARAESIEERDSAFTAMIEILDQKPVRVQRLEETCGTEPGPGLAKWLGFVSERIRTLRIQAQMTQDELAEKSGLPQSHISRLENGRHSPSHATLQKIAVALGVPVSQLDPSEE